jgi:hypothetical protein
VLILLKEKFLMSQEDVYKLIKMLGGRATTAEIKKLAQQKYPDRTLHQYVGDRLKKLQKWGFVEKVGDYWVIRKKWNRSH